MASSKDNIKNLMKNSRSRVIILFTIGVLLLAVLIAFFKLRSEILNNSNTSLRMTPNIDSTPGSLNQSPEYAALQNKQNIEKAAEALKKGNSAIPTIINMQAFGDGVDVVGPQGGTGGADFSTLSRSGDGTQKPMWLQDLDNNNCDKKGYEAAIAYHPSLFDLKESCSCKQLKNYGKSLHELKDVCDCGELRLLGYSAVDMKIEGYDAEKLRHCGFSACEVKAAGFSPSEMENAGFSDGELKGAGFNDKDLAAAGGLPSGRTSEDVKQAGCSVDALKRLRAQGVTAAAIRRISGCSIDQLKAAGFTADELKKAGFAPAELLASGFSPADLRKAGFDANDLKDAGLSDEDLAKAGFSPGEIKNAIKSIPDYLSADNIRQAGCSLEVPQKAKEEGMSAADLRKSLGCTADVLKQAGFSGADLKKAGFSPGELLKAGLSPADLLAAGFSPADLKAAGLDAKALKAAGVSAKDLLNAGFKPSELADAGFGAKDLLDAGVSPEDLKKLGFDAAALKKAGVSAAALKKAGFNNADLKAAGFDDNAINGADDGNEKADALASVVDLALPKQVPSIVASAPGVSPFAQSANQNIDQLNKTLEDQKKIQAQQRFQQKIQQKTSALLAYSNQLLQGWKTVPVQQFAGGKAKKESEVSQSLTAKIPSSGMIKDIGAAKDEVDIKTGDILFAIVDTAVNSDEPGPILATITTGVLKGSKIIGTFNASTNADKMTLTFTTLSIPGVSKTIGISAYAIDPNTGRTALSSSTNHHYLERYGALFASTFLEGFGNAFQSSDTTITIGGNGSSTNTTVQNGIGRSLTDNAVIGLATLGKAWGQQAQKNMNVPTTIQIYSGTAIGILFLQDVKIAEK